MIATGRNRVLDLHVSQDSSSLKAEHPTLASSAVAYVDLVSRIRLQSTVPSYIIDDTTPVDSAHSMVSRCPHVIVALPRRSSLSTHTGSSVEKPAARPTHAYSPCYTSYALAAQRFLIAPLPGLLTLRRYDGRSSRVRVLDIWQSNLTLCNHRENHFLPVSLPCNSSIEGGELRKNEDHVDCLDFP